MNQTFMHLIECVLYRTDLQILKNFTNQPPICTTTHKVECPCLFGPMTLGRDDLFNDLMYRWQAIDLEVGNYEEFDLDDFTVVVQPFLLNYTFPITSEGYTDYSYLSTDCFHFSQKGHARGKKRNNISFNKYRKAVKISF